MGREKCFQIAWMSRAEKSVLTERRGSTEPSTFAASSDVLASWLWLSYRVRPIALCIAITWQSRSYHIAITWQSHSNHIALAW